MAKKQKHPEHVNLERYLISYADFITLLFATFVVLYALSQTDINAFKSMQESIKQAFEAPSLMQGATGVMQQSGTNSLFDASQADSVVAPLMMEYMSPKYENDSIEEIKKDINEKAKKGDLKGFEALDTERGLLIRFNDDLMFQTGSAVLTPNAKTKLDQVGKIICKKFVLHNMRIEGHTDSSPLKSSIYPSNWELSSARASSVIRYFISRFSFMSSLFTAVGFSDTRPLVNNDNPTNMAKNRRVEILILKNKYKSQESAKNDVTKMSKADQERLQSQRMQILGSVGNISVAAKKLAGGDKNAEANTVILNKAYDNESHRLSEQTRALEPESRDKATGKEKWLKPPAPSAQGVKVFESKK